VGTLGLTSFLVALLLAVSQGSDWGWTSARILGLFAASVLIGPLWGWYEQRTAVPMVDMRTLARPAVLLTNLGALLIGLAFFANTLVTAQLVQEPKSTGYGLGASLVVGGLCSMPGGVVMVLLSPVSARISRRLGPKTTLAQGAALMLVGYLVRFETSHRLWTIIAGATVVAAGTALAYSALPALMMRAVPASETAAANGLNTLMRTIGQAFSSTVVASILTSITFQVGGRTAPTFHAYQLIFLFAAAAALLALVIALLIPSGARGGDGNDARPWRHARRLHPRLSTGHLG
jgi:MFS family permease